MPSPCIRKISLSHALDKHLRTVSVHKKGHQQEFYRSNVIKRYPIILRNVDEITTVDITTYRDVRLTGINPQTGKPITGNTAHPELALLSSLSNIARVERGTCRINPVELVRKSKVSSGRDRQLTPSEGRRFSCYFREKNLTSCAIFHLALEVAMRRGEILALHWEHIDLRHGVAYLPETKNGHSRDVPLSRRVRNFLQAMPVSLHDNVFDYTAPGSKNAWRITTQRLRIEDPHFHDLRHEIISRFFELGSLNVMEIVAISGHHSMNMLKRYAHLRAWQLVSKFDARRRQTQKVAAQFMPYPARVITISEENGQKTHCIEIGDFDNLHVTVTTKEKTVHRASEVLLCTSVIAAQKGERVPSPGALPVNDFDYIMTYPLDPGSAPL